MILVVGGSNQGKLNWALENFGCTQAQVWDGNLGELPSVQAIQAPQTLDHALADYRIIWHLEGLLRRIMQQNWQPEELLALQSGLLRLSEDMVIICASVGGGLVPIQRFDREWRELVGRTCCTLAAEASQVWRIFCGLPQRLK